MLASCWEMETHRNAPKHQATALDREVIDTAISEISNSRMTLESSKKMDAFFYIAKIIVITTK